MFFSCSTALAALPIVSLLPELNTKSLAREGSLMLHGLVTRKEELERLPVEERGKEYLEVLEKIGFYVAWDESNFRGEEFDFLTEL